MFSLVKNEFLDKGICRYEDEYGNSVFMKRNGQCFVGKLRFFNKNVKLDPVRYDPCNRSESGGFNTSIKFPEGVNIDDDDIKGGIDGFTAIVQRWVCMVSDISMFSSAQVGMAATDSMYPGMTAEDVWKDRMTALTQYDELTPLTNTHGQARGVATNRKVCAARSE